MINALVVINCPTPGIVSNSEVFVGQIQNLSQFRGSLQDAPAFAAVSKDNLTWDTALRSRPKFASGCNRVLPRSPLLPSSPLFEQDFGRRVAAHVIQPFYIRRP